MKPSFKVDVTYLKEVYEDEYGEKISMNDFWDMVVCEIEDLIRSKQL